MSVDKRYPSLPPLRVVKLPPLRERVPKGHVRAAVYDQQRFQQATFKPRA